MAFYKIRANIVKAYDDNARLIERKDRGEHEVVEFMIYSKARANAVGMAASKLMAEGISHDGIEILKEINYANANS